MTTLLSDKVLPSKLSDDRILAGQLAYQVEEATCGKWKKGWLNNAYVAFSQLMKLYRNGPIL